MRKKSNPIVESMYRKYAIPTGKNIRQTLKESFDKDTYTGDDDNHYTGDDDNHYMGDDDNYYTGDDDNHYMGDDDNHYMGDDDNYEGIDESCGKKKKKLKESSINAMNLTEDWSKGISFVYKVDTDSLVNAAKKGKLGIGVGRASIEELIAENYDGAFFRVYNSVMFGGTASYVNLGYGQSEIVVFWRDEDFTYKEMGGKGNFRKAKLTPEMNKFLEKGREELENCGVVVNQYKVEVGGSDKFDSTWRQAQPYNESLKESMQEIDRRYFASLNKEGDGHYYILVDGNYEKDFYADSDEEAKRKFAEWNGKAESLTEKLSDEEKQARREWRAFEKINNSFDDSGWNNWNQEQRDMFCDKVAQRFLKMFPHPTQMFFDWLENENFHTQSRAFDRLLSEALAESLSLKEDYEQDSFLSQIKQALSTIIYRARNDGDVFDNRNIEQFHDATYLGDCANWLDKNVPEVAPILEQIRDAYTIEQYYDYIITPLVKYFEQLDFDGSKYENIPPVGDIFNCRGSYGITPYEEYYQSDYYDLEESLTEGITTSVYIECKDDHRFISKNMSWDEPDMLFTAPKDIDNAKLFREATWKRDLQEILDELTYGYSVSDFRAIPHFEEDSYFSIPESLSLKEDWTHFEFTSGSNPYIAKTEKEKNRMLRKYKGRIQEVKPGFYKVDDKKLKESLNGVDKVVRASQKIVQKDWDTWLPIYYDIDTETVLTEDDYRKLKDKSSAFKVTELIRPNTAEDIERAVNRMLSM